MNNAAKILAIIGNSKTLEGCVTKLAREIRYVVVQQSILQKEISDKHLVTALEFITDRIKNNL